METVADVLPASSHRRIAPLTVVLGAVFIFFCAVLLFVFIATKSANPVMLDEQGKPVKSESRPVTRESR